MHCRRAAGVSCGVYEGPCGGMSCPSTSWESDLQGDHHVPPVITEAAGSGTFRLDPQGQVAYSITMTTLPGTAITSAVIHRGTGLQAPLGEVAIALCGTGNPIPPCATLTSPGVLITDTFAITPEQLNILRSAGYYANVTTADHPGGEIRGLMRSPHP